MYGRFLPDAEPAAAAAHFLRDALVLRGVRVAPERWHEQNNSKDAEPGQRAAEEHGVSRPHCVRHGSNVNQPERIGKVRRETVGCVRPAAEAVRGRDERNGRSHVHAHRVEATAEEDGDGTHLTKMLGGASQMVSMIRVKCNGKYKTTHRKVVRGAKQRGEAGVEERRQNDVPSLVRLSIAGER